MSKRTMAAVALALAVGMAGFMPASAQVAGPTDPSAKPVSRPVGPGEVSHNAPINGILTLYGNERCPTDNSGNEIVVCVRRSAEEKYRIPKEIRTFQVTPENESWANKVVAHDDVANLGIGSCSPVGPGGSTGCFLKQARATKKDNQARKDGERQVQESLP